MKAATTRYRRRATLLGGDGLTIALAAATLLIVGSILIATSLMMNMLVLMRKTFGG